MRNLLMPRVARRFAGFGAAVVLAGGTVAGVAASQASVSPAQSACSPTITRAPFGQTIEPYTGVLTQVYRYTLTNCGGMQIRLLSYGAITQSIDVPGSNGQEADVVLGFSTLQDYVTYDSPPVTVNGGPYFGETVGRYANRIAKGTFQLQQPSGLETYTLPVNNGVNDLHGGLEGFGDHIWSQVGSLISNGSEVGVTLQLVSPNGDASGAVGSPGCPDGCTGFPAQVTVDVTFTLNNADQYGLHYQAVNDSSDLNTVINLTNHSYFNLAGENSPAGSAYGQYVQINANQYTPTDTTQIPLGYNTSVKGTPFDFTTPQQIGSRIDDVSAPTGAPAADNQLLTAEGYDFNWVLNPQSAATTGPDGLNLAAHAWDPASGRELTVWTNQPGVQFYSGNFLTGTLVGITGDTYRQGAGYTFETQHFPNSPNQPNFPTTELKAGATFTSETIDQFSSAGSGW
jgi:aldose 1-epimerase